MGNVHIGANHHVRHFHKPFRPALLIVDREKRIPQTLSRRAECVEAEPVIKCFTLAHIIDNHLNIPLMIGG